MSFQTLLIAGSDPESLNAIRARIPENGFLVHTLFADPGRLARLLHGIDFDVILIDRNSRDADALHAIVDQAKAVCVVIGDQPDIDPEPGRNYEVVAYPCEQEALVAALLRACRRREQRFYLFSVESSALH